MPIQRPWNYHANTPHIVHGCLSFVYLPRPATRRSSSVIRCRTNSSRVFESPIASLSFSHTTCSCFRPFRRLRPAISARSCKSRSTGDPHSFRSRNKSFAGGGGAGSLLLELCARVCDPIQELGVPDARSFCSRSRSASAFGSFGR